MKKWSIYILLSLLVASCTLEEDITPPVNQSGNAGEVTLRISFSNTEQVMTKALSEVDENKIDSLRLFIFKDGTTANRLDDIYMYDVRATGIADDSPTPYPTKKATAKLKSTSYQQRFMLVANIPAGLTLALNEGVTTMRDIISQLSFSGAPWRTELTSTNFTPFPMWGQILDFHDVGATATSPFPNPVPVNLIRTMAKIGIGVDVNNSTGDPALGFGSVFKIKTVYVCNASDSGRFAPHADFLNSTTTLITKPNTIPGFRIDSVKYGFPDVVPSVLPRLFNTIYVPETDSLITGGVSNPAFLVLKASYYSDTAFYRIDFTDNDHYIPLIRNHSYIINITGLRKPGYATLLEAVSAPVISVINPALVLDNADVTISDITYNKDYYLGAGTTEKKIDWMAQTNITIPVKTSYQSGWTAQITNGGGFITALTTSSGAYNTLGNLGFTVQQNVTGQPRSAEIKVTAGTLYLTIKVIQSGGSYSYIVSTGSSISIPLTSANLDGTTRVTSTTSGTLEQLWVSNASPSISTLPVSGNSNVAVIQAGTQPGAAVYGFFSGTTLLASYMVWVVPAAVNLFADNGNVHSYNGYTFMDYYLGSTSSATQGALFQWGRKDAFPDGFDVSYPTYTLTPFVKQTAPVSVASDNVNASFVNPTVFFTNTSYPYDWNGSFQNNSLWATPDGGKGYYDPCPFGWRVPLAENNLVSPWNGFTNGNNGLSFLTNTVGYNGMSGAKINNAGYVWSASARGLDAYGYKAGVGGQTTHRVDAYQIRCVRDNIKRIQ
jgi:hypothetical protein